MKAVNITEAWKIAYEIADTGTYEMDKESTERAGYKIYRSNENFYSRICDLGCRLEIVKADGTSINVWIESKQEQPKKHPEHRAMVHYKLENGNSQHQLQLLAADIMKHGKQIMTCRHVSQEFDPNGETRTIETGSYCTEVLNELTGTRYWVHFSGCRVTEIIEAFIKE